MSFKQVHCRKKMVINFILFVALFYLGILALLYFSQRSMMYFPEVSRPDYKQSGLVIDPAVKVTTTDHLTIEGWYFPPSTKKKVLVYFHGNAFNHAGRLSKVNKYIADGYGVLLAGYRGYGGNPGSPSEQGFYQDARAWMDYLTKTQSIPSKDIIIYGESIGTGVAVQMASEYPDVAGLILEAPYSSTVDVAKARYPFIPVSLLMKDQYRSFDKISKIHKPLLIIHGKLDNVINISFSHKLFEAANEPKEFVQIDTAAHNDLYDHGAPLHVLRFLSKISGKKD